MHCALWLNHRKVYNACDIPDNLDLASLCGYFAAGSLLDWLKTHGGERYAAKLEKISPKDPLLKEKLEEIFGGKPVANKEFGNGACSAENPVFCGCSQIGNSSVCFSASRGYPNTSSLPRWRMKMISSFNFSSYTFSSYLLKIGFGSAKGGFFSLSSSLSSGIFGYEWEWEWERFLSGYGSFNTTSFGYSSFLSALRAFFAKNYGSRSYGSASSRYFGSFFGSFNGFALKNGFGSYILSDSEEYDRILMECVFGCPLNGCGYGIHNI